MVKKASGLNSSIAILRKIGSPETGTDAGALPSQGRVSKFRLSAARRSPGSTLDFRIPRAAGRCAGRLYIARKFSDSLNFLLHLRAPAAAWSRMKSKRD